MKSIKSLSVILLVSILLLVTEKGFSQDPNFHIYLCFGQSNMEGQGTIESKDLTVDSRFKVMAGVNCSNLGRVKGTWYTAVPPLARCYTKLSPSDYFGKTMVANLPDSITIGVINVSVAGCNIGLFDKVNYVNYLNTFTAAWYQNILADYSYNPYAYMINLAQLAQQDGVIKGILLHQGEANTGDSQWPTKVQTIYNDMLADLSLSAADVPLLAGQLLGAAQNGCCSSMNSIINTLPATIPTSHVISSINCTGQPDNAHFNSEGYRKIGKRYAVQMLSLQGYKASYAEAECGVIGNDWLTKTETNAANGGYIKAASGIENLTVAPISSAQEVQMNFTVDKDTTYYVYGRFNNPSTASDAYWVKMDNGVYEKIDNLTTTGWQWLPIKSYALTAGSHSVVIGIAENGGYLDKIALKNAEIAPVGVAEEAANACVITITSTLDATYSSKGYSLMQSYPHPGKGTASISFVVPKSCYVSVKLYNAQGIEISELAGKEFRSGEHVLTCRFDKLPAGNYFYTMRTDEFKDSRKLLIVGE